MTIIRKGQTGERMPHAVAIEISDNGKTGPCSVTYASQGSCPQCPFLNSGCYAEYGPIGIITRRLNNSGTATAEEIALEEASAIDRLRGLRPLRLHAVGDCRTDAAAKIVARAVYRYRKRGMGQRVWTYTHAWRKVKRKSWGEVSVLASCERVGQIEDARARGYATALTVGTFASRATYLIEGEKVIPCPAQTRDVTCVDCKLCWDDDRLLRSELTIGFELHGSGRRRALDLIGG